MDTNDTFFNTLEMSSIEYGKIDFSLDTPESTIENPDSSLIASCEFGSILRNEIWDDDYNIWRYDFKIEKDTRILWRAVGKSSIGLAFTLKNDFCYKLKGISGCVSRKHQYNFIYIPSFECECQFTKGEYAACGIRFSLAFLEKWKYSFPMLTDFVNRVKGALPVSMVEEFPYATPRMLELIRDLQQCSYAGTQRKMFLEARVLELLLLSLQQIASRYAVTPLKQNDMDTILDVVEYLVEHFEESISLDSLVHKFGLNEFKLKAGFRYYGTTVFSYVQELRLQKARQLLEETDLPVKKIAEATGYKSLQYLSLAFKKKFGMSPGELKRGKPYSG